MDGQPTVSKFASLGWGSSGPISVPGPYGKGIALLDNVSSAAAVSEAYTGVWCDAATIKSATVSLDGSFTGEVTVEGCNLPNPTSATAGYTLLATNPTAPGLFAVSPLPVRWVRARVSGFTTGAVSCNFQGVA